MVSRPYKCPLCHSAFRSESGMKWHLAHKHEIPFALDAIHKDYDAKTTALEEENAQLKKKIKQMQQDIELNLIELVEEKKEKLQLHKQISELEARFQKALLKITARDLFIKEKLGIDMHEPNIT
jgi:septal ring factor EnvC (AmiA/AmiB activator)